MARKLFVFFVLVLVTGPALAHVDTTWVRRYNGPADSTDCVFDVSIDDSSCVYVTGTSHGGVNSRLDYATIKYDQDGDTVWVRRYDGTLLYAYDRARAVVVDDDRYVYVTGSGNGTSAVTGGEYTTIKYEPDGDTAWVRHYNGPWTGFEEAFDLFVDDSGYVYVTGESRAAPGHFPGDWATVKYDSNGDTVWARRWPDSTLDNRAYAIAVDDSGYVYVAGGSLRGAETQADIIVIRYYPNGDTVWLREYDGPASAGDIPAYGGIAVDESGNVYLTGRRDGGQIGIGDYVTIKYNPNGDTAWVRGYSGAGNGTDYAHSIAIDGSGNVYVTGCSDGGGTTGFDFATIKYQSNGDTAWIRRYNGPGNGSDSATAIVVDEGGNVYVTGTSYTDSSQGHDCITIRYNPDGTTAWVETYNGPDSGYDGGRSIALKDSNNVCVTGLSWGGASYLDYVTINYVQFFCGDANGNGTVGPEDIVYLQDYLYRGGDPPDPWQAGDCNMDDVIDGSDLVYLINYLYRNGPEPCAEE
jgi:hypothetical protein